MTDQKGKLAFYLIPPPDLCTEILSVRQIIQDQYQLSAALKFMVHMTIKGFFQPAPNVKRENLIRDLNKLVSGYKPFKIYPGALRIKEDDCSLVIDFPENRNKYLWQIYEDCIACIEPYIAESCDFTSHEKIGFTPHITLTMIDATLGILKDAKEYLGDVVFSSSGYAVNNFKLYEFLSEAWGTPGWIHTMSWRILHNWRLKS